MKVVVDANVFVSAAIRTGPPHRIVQAWLERRVFEVVMCPALLGEVQETLDGVPTDAPLDRSSCRRAVRRDDRGCRGPGCRPGEVLPLTRDPEDDYLIALARIHGAEYIVSGDRDLLEWEEQRPPVVTPAAFAALLR